MPAGFEPPSEGTPLYVHLPFCAVKCTYCDFFSVVAEGVDLEPTLKTVLEEADRRAPRAPRSVFLGGGTPSLLSTRSLERLLDGLDARTGFRASAVEVTLEANPESLDLDKARALRSLGVTRLSIGLQSLRPWILQLFGRPHGVADGLRAYETARRAGIDRVSLDLIYAVPGQTVDEWNEDIDQILALHPDHISAYALTFEPGTPLFERLRGGEVVPLGEEVELAFLQTTRKRLTEGFLEAYEVSNYSTTGEQCLHNINYWRNGPYVGLGPSAVTKVGPTRSGNPRSLPGWMRTVASGGEEGRWQETLPPARRLGETWWLGLRLEEGVVPDEARARAGYTPEALSESSGARRDQPDPAEALAVELCLEGWLERRGSAYALSERGLPLADTLGARFLSAEPPAQPPSLPPGAIPSARRSSP